MMPQIANELRLGNIVHHNSSVWSYRNDDGVISNYGKLLEDCFQWSSDDWYALSECTLSWDAIEPIELTEELLLKCGFKIESTVGGFIRWENGSFKLIDWRLPYPVNYHKPVVYLHQLQNLYFALTGQELDVSQIID